MKPLVSFVVPAYNMEETIDKCLVSIINQNYPKNKIEIIVINDASTDKTYEIAKNILKKSKVKYKLLSNKKNMKIPFTSNVGINAASGKFIAYIDSDAILEKNWLIGVLPQMEQKTVGAVAGFIRTANPENFWARLAGYELEWRYAQLRSETIDHVSTTNTLYRKKALEDVKENGKYFDENFHYGLDTDMSNRLRERGWKLIQLKNTCCFHYWKTSFRSYFKQCFNTGYARLRLMKKYKKIMIDKVTTLKLSLQVPLMGLLLLNLFLSLFFNFFFLTSFLISIGLLSMQISRAVWVFRTKKDKTIAFLFPFLIQIRNFAVIFAILRYLFNKLRGMEK